MTDHLTNPQHAGDVSLPPLPADIQDWIEFDREIARAYATSAVLADRAARSAGGEGVVEFDDDTRTVEAARASLDAEIAAAGGLAKWRAQAATIHIGGALASHPPAPLAKEGDGAERYASGNGA